MLEIGGKLAGAPVKKMAREAFSLLSSALSQAEPFGAKCCRRRLVETGTGGRGRGVGLLEKFHHDGAKNRFDRVDSPLLRGQYRAREST